MLKIAKYLYSSLSLSLSHTHTHTPLLCTSHTHTQRERERERERFTLQCTYTRLNEYQTATQGKARSNSASRARAEYLLATWTRFARSTYGALGQPRVNEQCDENYMPLLSAILPGQTRTARNLSLVLNSDRRVCFVPEKNITVLHICVLWKLWKTCQQERSFPMKKWKERWTQRRRKRERNSSK